MDNLKNNLEQREKNELIALIQHMLHSTLKEELAAAGL